MIRRGRHTPPVYSVRRQHVIERELYSSTPCDTSLKWWITRRLSIYMVHVARNNISKHRNTLSPECCCQGAPSVATCSATNPFSSTFCRAAVEHVRFILASTFTPSATGLETRLSVLAVYTVCRTCFFWLHGWTLCRKDTLHKLRE